MTVESGCETEQADCYVYNSSGSRVLRKNVYQNLAPGALVTSTGTISNSEAVTNGNLWAINDPSLKQYAFTTESA